MDESTGNMSRFTGKYHLTIIGGGKDINSIEEYSTSDVALFNYQTHGYVHTVLGLGLLNHPGLIDFFTRFLSCTGNYVQPICNNLSSPYIGIVACQ